MRNSKFYCNDVYLGTLYENGYFSYMLDSSYADKMNIESVLHQCEIIRKVGQEKDFNYDSYIQSYKDFPFKDGFEFR